MLEAGGRGVQSIERVGSALDGAVKAKRKRCGRQVVGVPKTIDNDRDAVFVKLLRHGERSVAPDDDQPLDVVADLAGASRGVAGLLGQEDLDLKSDDNLLTSGLVDSLSIMRLVAFIEEEFATEVPPEDITIENFLTIQHILDYLETRIPT